MASLRDLRREVQDFKSTITKDSKGGFTQEEKAYYREHPIEFAEEQLYFKRRLIRLSDDQKEFLLFAAKWDPDIKAEQDDWASDAGDYILFDEESELEMKQEGDKIILVASRNGGKTLIFAVYALWRALFFSDLWIREMGGSMPQARIFYHMYFKEFIRKNNKIYAEVDGKVQAERTSFKNGSTVEMSACSETATRGPHPDILLLDEVAAADKAKKTDVIKAALDSAIGQIMMASTAHHVSGLFIDYLLKADIYGYEVFRWPVCDLDIEGNIIRIRSPWIPRDRIEHARLTKTENEFRVEWMADVASTAAMVFPLTYIQEAEVKMEEYAFLSEFEENIERMLEEEEAGDLSHIPKPMRIFYDDDLEEGALDSITKSTFGGADIGLVHPTAIVILYKDENDIFWVVHEEHYRGRDATWRANRISELQELYHVEQFCLDAEDVTFFQLCQNAGASVFSVPFQNYKMSLIGTLRNLFEKKRIRIPTKYDTLLDQLKGYTYDANQKPIKKNDDCIDALLFAIYFWNRETQDSGEIIESADLW